MTKKLRFEVFKRDGFCCGYCGRRPPDVVLEVDHITPVCKGGKDKLSNLLTSCFDCNRGKAGTPIDKKTHQEAAKVLKEKRDQLRAYNRLIEAIEHAQEEQVNRVEEVFRDYGNASLRPNSRRSVKRFISKLGTVKVIEAAEMAFGGKKQREPDDAFKYMCGICWNWIRGPKDGKD